MLRALLPEIADPNLADRLGQEQRACYRRDYLDHVRPFPVARILLERMARMGYSIALVADCAADELRHYVRLARIAAYVDATVCGDDTGEDEAGGRDRALAVIYHALAKARGCPADALMIGDAPAQVGGARRAGVTAIGLLSGGFSHSEMVRAGCAAVYRNLAALLDNHFKYRPADLRGERKTALHRLNGLRSGAVDTDQQA